NFRDIQSATLGKATEGTGDWICVWKEFIIWLASDGYIRILWGSGMPGAGKSILASLAINAVETRAKASLSPICVGYLYIRYSDSTKFTVRDLLEILVKQTVERHPAALPLCTEVYARHVREKTEPSTTELVALLKSFTSELVTTSFYFVDALDEAPADVQLELLEKLAALNVKLFITSRPLDQLESRYPDAHHFPIFAQDADLDVHIDKEISRSMELQAILAASSPGLGGRITLTVKRKCSGMFLHASLHLQALRECTNRRDLEKTLAEFPAKLADAYAETWDRIINQSLGKALLAMNVFTWVLYATRSLSVEELRHAVASCPDTHKFEPGGLVVAEILVSVCCGLLVIEEETQQVRLVHYTAKAILQALLVKVVPYPHSLLAAVCMNRLSKGGFQRSSINSKSDLDTALKASPLLPYAYHAWSEHAQASLDDVVAHSRVSSFLRECHSFPIMRRRYGILGRFGPLPVAAYFDLPLSLADSDYLRSINIPTREEGLALLHLACIGNARRVAKELLDLPKIQVNAVDKQRSTALICASFCGNEHIVELLLSHPHIKINQVSEGGVTPLHWASDAGHTATVKLLLADPKIKVNQRLSDDYNATALISAAHIGQTETGQTTPCSSPDQRQPGGQAAGKVSFDVRGDTTDGRWCGLPGGSGHANCGASQGKVRSAFRRSIHKPPDPNRITHHMGFTPLGLAALQAHETRVEELLSLPRVRANAVDKDGWSVLAWAAAHGRDDIIKLLLAHRKVKVNQADAIGWTALMRAPWRGHEDTVKLLLADPKIKVNHTDENGATVLIIASGEGNVGTVSLLLDHPQVKVNLADNEGRSALISAIRGRSLWAAPQAGNRETVKLLLEYHQINVNQADKKGWTALQWATHEGQMEMAQCLVSHPQIKTATTADALADALNRGHERMVRLFDELSRRPLGFGRI
ncbi:ankyrin repeat-containing domain protein, partial [Coprinopsis sp. MPI-PUGE-AT-0042]